MNSTLKLAFGLVLSTLTVGELSAQWNIGRTDGPRNFAYASVGLDPALIASAGYIRTVPVFGHAVEMGGEAGIVAAGWDARDFRARLQLRTSLLRLGVFRIVGSAAFVARGTDNLMHRAFNFGSDFTGNAGLYARRWFLAGEFGFDKSIVTHLKHSDIMRTSFPQIRDGWFMPSGGNYYYGIQAGKTLGETYTLSLRVGMTDAQFDDEDALVPYYVQVGFGMRL